MKRFFAVLAVSLAAAAFAFAGGAADSGSGAKPAEKKQANLRLWMGIPPESGPQAVVDAFNAEFKDKGIQIEYERYVNDDQGNLKLETSLLAGGDIDVYVTYGNYRTKKRAEANMALDLSALMARDKFDHAKISGETALTSYVNGKPYSLYTTLGKGSLLVNKDMFDKAGIPLPTDWTFDEFREIAKKLTSGEGQSKVYGMFWNSQQNIAEYMSYLAQLTLGGDWAYNPDAKSTRLDNEIFIKATELINNTMNMDKSAPTHVDSVTQKLTQESMFLTGRSAMIIGNWSIRSVKNVKDYPHDFVTAYVPYPVIEKSKRNYIYGGMGDEMTINPKSANVDAAWEFVKWYATNGVKYMSVGGRFGLASSVNKDEMVALFSKGAEKLIDMESVKRFALAQPGDKLTIPTITAKGPEIYKVLNEEMEAALTGRKDVATALKDAKKRSDAFLAQ